MGGGAQSAEQVRLVRDAAVLGVALDDGQAQRLLRLLDELVRWNRSYNLTSIDGRDAMLTHHLLDSLSIAPFVTGATLADVGTGAGFPGLPLAIAAPGRQCTLIDSNNKKIRFVAHATRTLGLANVTPLQARVEELAPAVPYDTVVARAFAPLPRLLAQVERLCGPGTRVLAMKGARLDEEMRELPAPWQALGLHELRVPGIDAVRTLAVLRRPAV
ncbi:MAG: Ribosomal RNA small subunit methyltransferase G [Steroidobacteraceae bacterium]|nr:Ribosomal RNA small subunit methyltransferase G [Steroidobacteraceae bacterium]